MPRTQFDVFQSRLGIARFAYAWLALICLAQISVADDRQRLESLFANAGRGETIVIPPGEYQLDGTNAIALRSGTRVSAYGARFVMPARLANGARLVLFQGTDLTDFEWLGGSFHGNVFDPAVADNGWEPNVNTRCILVTTTRGGHTGNLRFRDIRSDGVAGAVVTVLGANKAGSNSEVDTYATNVTLENCDLLRSGKFMWDYGYLWQITVWPEEHSERERAMAQKYFPRQYEHALIKMQAGSNQVEFDNAKGLSVEEQNRQGGVLFYGDTLPSNIVRGKRYFLLDSQPQYVRIAESLDGKPITFASSAGANPKMMSDLFRAYWALYAPEGSGPGKGAFDFVACKDVVVRGNRLSALGDTMHIQKSTNVIFSENQILGSRMGAFFIAEFCSNVSIVGNTIDGTNGSRVMSVEKSTKDITIVGNTFRGGGRGSWINQPTNFILANNIFENNTTKCEHDPQRGRKSFETGDYSEFAELYFTTHEPGGTYSNVIIQNNVFTSGPFAKNAISFDAGGSDIQVFNNIFRGPKTDIEVAAECRQVEIRSNIGTKDHTQ